MCCRSVLPSIPYPGYVSRLSDKYVPSHRQRWEFCISLHVLPHEQRSAGSLFGLSVQSGLLPYRGRNHRHRPDGRLLTLHGGTVLGSGRAILLLLPRQQLRERGKSGDELHDLPYRKHLFRGLYFVHV